MDVLILGDGKLKQEREEELEKVSTATSLRLNRTGKVLEEQGLRPARSYVTDLPTKRH